MIVFDLQAIQSAAHGERGIARYVADLAMALQAEHPDAIDAFLWNDNLPRVARLDTLGLATKLRSFSEVRGTDVDILHVNSPFELLDFGEIAAPIRARKVVVTCYDLIPYRFPDRYLSDPTTSVRYRTRLGLLATADAVVTDSQSAATDVETLLGVAPRRLTVIGGGVGPQFCLPTSTIDDRINSARAVLPKLSPRFIFVPTGMDWRKNYVGAIEAYGMLPERLRNRHQLVLSCKVDDHQRAAIDEICENLGLSGRVLITGYVSDELLVTLYQTAELVLYPSFYEGFGLPVLEARSCGARVICSGVSSLPEVLTDERATFNPWDVADIASTLERAIDDPTFAAILDRVPDSGFNWSESARRLVGVYDRLSREQPRTTVTRSGPLRLGIVTLMPPTPSGIADHSARLVQALNDHVPEVDVTVFVEETATWSTLDVPIFDLATLPGRWLAGELDAVLYCFGNNRFHRSFFPMMRVVPGHALVHDVQLDGAFNRLQIDQFAQKFYDHDVDADTRFVKPVAIRATSVLVQSEHAAQLVLSESGVAATNIGPHPCAEVETSEPIRDGGPPWVVTMGIADISKGSDVVVAAFEELASRRPIRTALVGLGGERFLDAASSVVATGQVTAGEYDKWLRRATVTVQLRRTTNGESSGVAADAMARGVPLIVTDLGAMSELPSDATVKVPVDVTSSELAATIESVLDGDNERAAMRVAGLEFAACETPTAQALRIVEAIFPDRL